LTEGLDVLRQQLGRAGQSLKIVLSDDAECADRGEGPNL
jgi:hypothetical protein